MKKQKSSSIKIDDDYTQATKKLIKKTLVGMSVAVVMLLLLGFWVFKKVTTPKKDVALQPSPSAEVLAAASAPSPTADTITTPSPSLSSTPTTSPLQTASPIPSPSKSPSSSPSSIAASTAATQSPTPSQSPNSEKTITSQPMLDGYQSNNGSGSTTAEIKIGRNATSTSRGFVSFDITQIMGSSSIDKAVFRIYQQGVSGNPYTSGSDLKIDQLNYGSTFEASDYSISSISSSFATISSGSSIGWKEVDVTQNIKGDLAAGRMRSQFRLHFSVEQIGGNGDYALFESADNALKTGNAPQLVTKTH